MSLKPTAIEPVPATTAQVARAAFPHGNVYRLRFWANVASANPACTRWQNARPAVQSFELGSAARSTPGHRSRCSCVTAACRVRDGAGTADGSVGVVHCSRYWYT
jgi:hypothetical protein